MIEDSFNHHAIVGLAKTRTLQDGRKVSEIKNRGQQVYWNDLELPVFLSWVWLKRDGKRVQRFVISTKPMKGSTIVSSTSRHSIALSNMWRK